jgi:hypothetical protein
MLNWKNNCSNIVAVVIITLNKIQTVSTRYTRYWRSAPQEKKDISRKVNDKFLHTSSSIQVQMWLQWHLRGVLHSCPFPWKGANKFAEAWVVGTWLHIAWYHTGPGKVEIRCTSFFFFLVWYSNGAGNIITAVVKHHIFTVT